MNLRALTRRHFFRESGFGIGGLGLMSLFEERLFAEALPSDPFALKPTHFAPKAKRVIYLFMAGRRRRWTSSTPRRSSSATTARRSPKSW